MSNDTEKPKPPGSKTGPVVVVHLPPGGCGGQTVN